MQRGKMLVGTTRLSLSRGAGRVGPKKPASSILRRTIHKRLRALEHQDCSSIQLQAMYSSSVLYQLMVVCCMRSLMILVLKLIHPKIDPFWSDLSHKVE